MGRRGARLDELEALYRSRLDVFARVAASVTGDSERARDAVQEAFATAVRRRGLPSIATPLPGYRVVTADAEMGLLRLDPQADSRSGFPRIGERVAEDLESLVRLDENRHGLVAHRIMSHHREPLSAGIPQEFDVDPCGMPGIEL
jgi:hypothetical protein